MLLHFRQGIVESQIPTFLQVTYPHVDLIVTDTNCTISFASGTKDYLFTEQQSVEKAWGPLYLGIDQWLYWDLDIRTGNRTFGITKVAPINSPTQPPSPMMDQHWFNTSTNEMKVWTGSAWVKRIRAFACKLAQGKIPVSVSANAPLFAGTQIGNNTTTYSGHILYDATTGNAIRDAVGNFMTTEDNLSTKTISLSQVKVASIIIEGVAQQNMAAHTIVRFTEFGKIEHADQFTADQQIRFGIIEQSVVVGQTVNVVTDGMISSESFDFASVGVNALLYCDASGQIVPAPVIPNQSPIGVVVDRKTLQLGAMGTKQQQSSASVDLATNLEYGIVRLSVPAEDADDPIVVGDNDPRWNSFVERTGDVMTGPLVLHAGPTQDLQAATKKYVDDSRTPAAGGNFMVQFNRDGEFAASTGLTYYEPMSTLSVGGADLNNVTIQSASGNIVFGAVGSEDGGGRNATLQGGVGLTTGAIVNPATIRAGNAVVRGGEGQGPVGLAGSVEISGGVGTAENGHVTIRGGHWSSEDPESSDGRRSDVAGGHVLIHGGNVDGDNSVVDAGNVTIAGGVARGSGSSGSIYLQVGGTQQLAIGPDGQWMVGSTANTGAAGQVLTSQGPNQQPTWADVATGTPVATLDDLTDVTITSPVATQVLTFNGTEWVNADPTGSTTAYRYRELFNIGAQTNTVTLSNSYTIGTNSLAVYVNGIRMHDPAYDETSPNVITFGELLEPGDQVMVEITSPELSVASGVEFLNDLGDVTLTAPEADDVLVFNGTEWVNGFISPVGTTTYVLGGPNDHTHYIQVPNELIHDAIATQNQINIQSSTNNGHAHTVTLQYDDGFGSMIIVGSPTSDGSHEHVFKLLDANTPTTALTDVWNEFTEPNTFTRPVTVAPGQVLTGVTGSITIESLSASNSIIVMVDGDVYIDGLAGGQWEPGVIVNVMFVNETGGPVNIEIGTQLLVPVGQARIILVESSQFLMVSMWMLNINGPNRTFAAPLTFDMPQMG